MKNFLNKLKKNKAFRTFLQAFIGSVVAIAPTLDYSSSNEVLKGSLTTLLISALSAGISAVMNKGNMEV